MANDEKDIKRRIAELKKLGYIVKPSSESFDKKTFDVNKEQWKEVSRIRDRMGLTQREAIYEALDLWLEKKRGDA